MKRTMRLAFLTAVALALAAPADLAAQGRGKAKGKQKREAGWTVRADGNDRIVLRDGRGREIVIRDRDVDRRFRLRSNRGGSPAFCRSGAGHPVHGRAWCLEKGFQLGRPGDVFFEGDDRVIFWDDGEIVVVRDRRLERDRSIWDRVLDAVLFWRD